MAARPLEGQTIAARADAAGGDAVGPRLQRDEVLDVLGERPLAEQVAHAAQVALPFLADIAHEDDVATGDDPRLIQRADIGQQDRQGGGVVADAGGRQAVTLAPDLHVGSGREYRVEVCGDQGQRSTAGSLAHAIDVADLVGGDLGQARRLQHLGEGLAAHLFLEGRGLDLGQGDDVGDDPVPIPVQTGGGHRELRARQNRLLPRHDRRSRSGGLGERRGGGGQQQGGGDQAAGVQRVQAPGPTSASGRQRPSMSAGGVTPTNAAKVGAMSTVSMGRNRVWLGAPFHQNRIGTRRS